MQLRVNLFNLIILDQKQKPSGKPPSSSKAKEQNLSGNILTQLTTMNQNVSRKSGDSKHPQNPGQMSESQNSTGQSSDNLNQIPNLQIISESGGGLTGNDNDGKK